MVLELLAVIAGLVLLAKASDRFVTGASATASALGMSPVVVGAVVIGFGTSTPELLVSGLAALQGNAALGVGNVIGSNTANLALVMAAAALVSPFAVHAGVLRRELPLAAAATVAFPLALMGGLTRTEGVVLVAALVAALVVVVAASRGPGNEELAEEVVAHTPPGRLRSYLGATLVGLVGTLAGAQALVWGATGIATGLGLSGGLVGLTLVAVGTSLPELMTAVAAVRRNEHELVVGNVLGSNLFNSLGVGGLIALLAPGAAVPGLLIAIVVMLGVTAAAAALLHRKRRLGRGEAALLLGAYVLTLPLLV